MGCLVVIVWLILLVTFPVATIAGTIIWLMWRLLDALPWWAQIILWIVAILVLAGLVSSYQPPE